MKNKIITGVTIFVFCLATFAVQATATDRSFSDYDIVAVSNQDLSAKADKAWVLSYDNQEAPIVITLHETKRSKNYVVRAEHFEVSYVCCKKGFGASMVKAEYSEIPQEIINRVINSEELGRQKILTPNEVSEEQALDLIAAYLPDLINPSYKHLLN
ncbi:hypothetical protein [Sunxiuqinia dokdonensis]|uniref:Uncharacterized protein n=1 Tax=Sunxiuqinia dokdonensis TaxID=1409788 RepID=A0A0L8VBJ6_9BACT|nr:hypothetical protein [Sunxiuqinia dokdonensis]KOH45860.1 hypothetical protein NC99_12920 [Sunxiuqinia dokdonensis]